MYSTKNYFANIENINDLRTQYKKHCLQFHPDKPSGDIDLFKAMQSEYEAILKKMSSNESLSENPAFNFDDEKDLFERFQAIMGIEDLIIELCGSWLWVSGNTKANRDTLKGNNFRYAAKKKMWYYSPYKTNGNRRPYSMDRIRTKYGSHTYKTKTRDKIEEAA